MKQKIFLLALTLVAAAAGCAQGSGNAWSREGFEQKTYGWKASFAAGQSDLVGPDWRLDNWTRNSDGTYDEKMGANYVADVFHDDDGDGVMGPDEVKRTFFYDLRYTNVHNNGVIWVETRTLSADDAGKDLDVLLENHSSSIAISGGTVRVIGGGGLPGLGTLRTIIADRTEIKLGDHSALSASIRRELPADKGDADTKPIVPTTRVVLMKFDYVEPASLGAQGPSAAAMGSDPRPPQRGPQRRTALMLIGYANDSERFDAGLADFARFLGRLSWSRSLAPLATPNQKGPAPKKPDEKATTPAQKPRAPDPDNPAVEI